jgi:hypothetical protein
MTPSRAAAAAADTTTTAAAAATVITFQSPKKQIKFAVMSTSGTLAPAHLEYNVSTKTS